MRLIRVFLCWLILLADLAGAANGHQAEVAAFTPQGEVRRIQQVAIRFDADMVPLGTADAAAPITLQCLQGGAEAPAGHWLDTRRYVLEWRADLPVGTHCVASLNAGLKSLDGRPLKADGPWEFTTGGPRLVANWPYTNSTIKEQQVFLLRPDALPDWKTIDEDLMCQVEGGPPVHGQRLSRAEGLAALHTYQSNIADGEWDSQHWLAWRCARPLPNNAKFRLIWSARIAAANGMTSRSDQIVNYTVRPPFTLGVTCETLPDARDCDPRSGIRLNLPVAVTPSAFSKISVVTADGTTVPLRLPDATTPVYSAITEPLMALEQGGKVVVSLTAPLQDSEGRILANTRDFPRTVTIGELPPYVGLVLDNPIVPAAHGRSGQITVAARHAERQLMAKAVHIGGDAGKAGERAALSLFHATDNMSDVNPDIPYPVLTAHTTGLPQQAISLTTDGGSMSFYRLPLTGHGLWLVEIDSPAFRMARLGTYRFPQARAAVVQVTNLNITLRASTQGHTLIWVTALDSGQPIADTELSLYDCEDKPVWQGRSAADGTAMLKLPIDCRTETRNGLTLVARKGDDLALLPLRNGVMVPLARVRGPATFLPSPQRPALSSHSVLDRTLFKAGETLHLENYIREQTAEGFRLPAPVRGTLEILFNASEVVYKTDLDWNAEGAAYTSWRIPANAKLGRYLVRVHHGTDGVGNDTPFQVEEYRAPVFDAQLDGAATWQAATARELPIKLSLTYLAGGAAAGEQVALRGTWNMGAPAPRTGFDFTNRHIERFSQHNESPRALVLDGRGTAGITLAPPVTPHPLTLFAEMQFFDPNGEVQTVARRFPVWPYRHKVGVRAVVRGNAADIGMARTVELSGVVLDAADQPLAGKTLHFTAGLARSAPNGRYTLRSEETAACDAVTNAQGEARCNWQPDARAPVAYNEMWLMTARADGEAHVATTLLYDWQLRWTASNAVIEVEGLNSQDQSAALPPDAIARLHIRAPFFPATMLVTVEREGVLSHSVHALTGADTRLPLPLKGSYAPNVQVAATFTRPMADMQPPVADQPVPVLQQHTVNLRVQPAHYALAVTLKPQHDEARPRQRVPVAITVLTPEGKPAAGAHVTLIAVDDALLVLRPNITWLLFDAMTRQRAVNLTHHALLTEWRVPHQGRQWDYIPFGENFEKPMTGGYRAGSADNRMSLRERMVAVPQAAVAAPAPAPSSTAMLKQAAAGEPAVRSDFSTLALWHTDVIAGDDGTATVEVPLNDSLTRWRLVAIATHKADRFGTGEATLRTVQPLQLVSGLPPSLRSGDALAQKVTLRNTTTQFLTVAFTAHAELSADEGINGRIDADPARGFALARTLMLKPGENQELIWPISVPEGVSRIKWRFTARAGDLGDAIEIEQAVTPSIPVTVRQATLLQVGKTVSLPVMRPAGAYSTAGSVSVDWKASLGDAALIEVRQWMQTYPFICLEQKASKFAALGDRDGWDALMLELPKYLDGNGLARYFPTTQLPGSEMLTAYVLDTAAALKWEIPAAEKTRMLDGLRAQLTGHSEGLDWAPQQASVARALALQATLSEQDPQHALAAVVTPTDMASLPTTALVDWIRYLLTTPKDARRSGALQEAAATLRARYDVQGTRLNWRDEARENWWWFMWNGNLAAARTVWIVNRWSAEDPSWKDELPLLVAGLVGRQQQGHWGTTTANVWGSIALTDFARLREAEPVSGSSSMRLGTQSASITWPGSAATTLGWPAPGSEANLTLSHSGSGAPWATVAVRAAVKLEQPVMQGLQVQRTVSAVEQKVAGEWHVGDTLRVTLAMTSNAELTWVAVRDPVPSGATILGRGLARESQLAQQDQQRTGAWPVFEERAADSYRGYYRHVPQGSWRVDYTLRLNNAGTFEFPPARVEAMYAPEIFGETPLAPLVVKP